MQQVAKPAKVERSPFILKVDDNPFVLNLPPHMAAPLTIYHAGGIDYHGVAEKLGIPLGTVKSRINRARAFILKARAKAAKEIGDGA